MSAMFGPLPDDLQPDRDQLLHLQDDGDPLCGDLDDDVPQDTPQD